MRRAWLAVLAMTAVTTGAFAADVSEPVEVPVASQLSGYVEGFIGFANQDYWASDYGGYQGFGGAGRANLNLDGWSIQLDVFGDHWDLVDDDFSYDVFGSFGGAAHLSLRDQTSYLIGVFGGHTKVSTYYTGYNFGGFFYGAEAQVYWGNLTLYGQVGGLNSVTGGAESYAPIDEFFARAVARYFFTPNTKLEAGATLLTGDIWGPTFPDRTINWNLKLEQKLGASPVSIFAEIDGVHSTYVSNQAWDPLYRAMAGVKLSFGSGTLQEQNNSGATLDTPDFGVIGWIRDNNLN